MTTWIWLDSRWRVWRLGWAGPAWLPAGNYIGALHIGPLVIGFYRGEAP